MAEGRSRLGIWWGAFEYYHGKGNPWVEMVRRWLLIAMGASATGRFVFDLPTRWNLVLLMAIPVLGEAVAALLGLLMHRVGSIEHHYLIAYREDPARHLPVERLEAVQASLGRIEALLARVVLVSARTP